MPPKVSIVTAAYNGEKYLEESINSMLNQTFDDFEFIIVDDGSTDNTLKTLQQFTDSRIRIIHQSNQGQTGALMVGIEQAQGELIARLDQDDYSHPKRLELQTKFMDANPKVVLCGSRFELLYGDHLAPQKVLFCETNAEIKKIISRYNPFAHSAIMFRRDSYLQVGGFDKRFVIGMDYDLFVRLMEVGEAYNIDKALVVIRREDGSSSMRQSRLKTLEGIKTRWYAYAKFGGNSLIAGFYFFKSIVGLVTPRWLKTLFTN